MKGVISAFILGGLLTAGIFLFIGANVVQGFRNSADSLRVQLEQANKALGRIESGIERGQAGIERSQGKLKEVGKLAEDGLGIIDQIRKQPLD